MRRRVFRVVKRDCQHARSVVASSAGVRRKVCQSCGHVSFEMTTQTAAANQTRLDEAV